MRSVAERKEGARPQPSSGCALFGARTTMHLGGKLTGVAGLQFPDHPPDAIRLAALDDLQGSRAVKRRIRLLQPLADGLRIHHVRKHVEEARQLGETLLRRT